MKPSKNLNGNLSPGTGLISTRATNEATSTASSSSSNQGITNPVFDCSPSQAATSASQPLVSANSSSSGTARYSIPPPPPLPNLQTARYFRAPPPVDPQQQQHHHHHSHHSHSHQSHQPTPISGAGNNNSNTNSQSDDSDDTHRTLVVSSTANNYSHHNPAATEEHSCEECVRFHAKKQHSHHHHHHPHHNHHQQPSQPTQQSKQVSRKSAKLSRTPSSAPYLKPALGFRPHPPQWYYLLGADSNKFRKHKHTYYHKNCKACKAIVRQSFEHYYLGQNSPVSTAGSEYPIHTSAGLEQSSCTPSESSSTAPLSFDNSDGLITERTSSTASPQPYNHIMSHSAGATNSSPMPPFYVMPRRRASCGHSCLKYTILFYCSVAVILAICAICYFTKMFGYIDPSLSFGSHTSVTSSSAAYSNNINNFSNDSMLYNSTGSNSIGNTSSTAGFGESAGLNFTANLTSGAGELVNNNNGQPSADSHTARIIDMLRAEVVALVIASAVMIIFFLGLIGGFLESVLCLRIFGAILSYLFLLTFGAALYIVILLVISHVQSKLILSAISCAGVAITIHAAIAIAPFAFADLISQEKEDELKELNNTSYMKFPSVRFLPMMSSSGLSGGKRRSSYFSLPFRASKRFLSRGNGVSGKQQALSSNLNSHHQSHHQQHQHQHHQHSSHHQSHNQHSSHQRHHSHMQHANRSSDRATPTDSTQHILFNTHQNHQDNSSSEGLIPAQSSVRFRDNWI